MGLSGRSRSNKSKKTVSANLITLLDPKAAASEAYRAFRTNLSYAGIDNEVKLISITSPSIMEGKSTTCANIAIAIAQSGKKVLLLDADLRKPKLHTFFALNNDVGMTDVLVKNASLESVLKSLDVLPNLHIMCSGFIPPNSSEILGSKRMTLLLAMLKANYDIVIIDTPPVGHLTDAAIVGKISDGAVLVLASGETNIDMARRAKTNLESAGAKILDVVLTKISSKAGGAYYYRYHDYKSYYE